MNADAWQATPVKQWRAASSGPLLPVLAAALAIYMLAATLGPQALPLPDSAIGPALAFLALLCWWLERARVRLQIRALAERINGLAGAGVELGELRGAGCDELFDLIEIQLALVAELQAQQAGEIDAAIDLKRRLIASHAAERESASARLRAIGELNRNLFVNQLFLRTAEQVARAGFWQMDPVSGETRWSPGALGLLGWTDAATPYSALRKRLADGARLEEAIAESRRTGGEFEIETDLLSETGQRTMRVRLFGRALTQGDGHDAGVVGAMFDVSRLWEAEERRRALMTQLSIAHGIVVAAGPDDDAKLRDLGQHLLGHFGCEGLVLSSDCEVPAETAAQWMSTQVFDAHGGSETLLPLLAAREQEAPPSEPFSIHDAGGRLVLRCLLLRAGRQRSRLLMLSPLRMPIDETDDAILLTILRSMASALDRIQLAAALQRAMHGLEVQLRYKSELMAGLSHEIGSPLAGVSNVLQALQDGQFGEINEMSRRLLSSALKTSMHINSLIEDLLDAARLESGHLRLQRQPCDLGSIAADAVEMTRPLADAKQQRIVLHHRVPCVLNVDRRRCLQMFSNLIGNAIKYTPVGGSIWISVRRSAAGCEVSVCDTGVGVRRDVRADIVRPFVRGQKALAQPGWGLGLAMVDMLAGLHGATMHIHSRSGRGSRFTIRFGADTTSEDSRSTVQ
jgi:signal transduction histidine kinase